MSSLEIVELDAVAAEAHIDELAQLLLDAHAANMALGLAAPLTSADATAAYRRTLARLVPGERILFGAFAAGDLVGSVHLARSEAGNGRHRAEIQRLVVRAAERGTGVGRALLDAAVDRARELDLSLLWLTTHEQTAADRIYERLGWTRVGVIPGYATLPDGSIAGNAFYYLALG